MASSSSVFNSLLTTLGSRSIGDIASRLGAPEQAISQGLETSTATLLAGLANKVGDSSWMNQLFKLVSEAPLNVNVSEVASAAIDPSRASSGTASLLDSGKKFLSLAFGGSQSAIFDTVSRSTGLRSDVVSSLMSMAAPLMITSLGRLVREDRMGAAGLGRVLVNQADDVRELVPSGIARLLSTSSATPPPISTTTTSARPLSITTVPEPTRSRAWLWLVPLLLIPVLLYWAYRVRHPVVPVVTVLRPIVVTNPPRIPSLNIPLNDAAARVLAFVQDPTKAIDQVTSFNFDQLSFDTNSATLRPGSQIELGYIAAILKAYPNVHLKIGGHTDSTGSPHGNLKLSQDRANGVKAALVAMGISPDRLETQGYGERSPVADNSTAEGRAKNRRISLTVTQK